MASERDFIVNDAGDMVIRGGVVVVGDALTDDVALLLMTSQGEMKLDPLAGCNMVRHMNAPTSRVALERVIKLQLERDGKRWEDVRNGINTMVGNG